VVFDFEKLEVYQIVKAQNLKALAEISQSTLIDLYIKDQWKRASLSILLNLAEGTGRMSVQDKKHYYTMARGSVFECAAILDLLHESKLIDEEFYKDIYAGYEQCSKMLLAMYRSMDRQAQ
jgi:four helix bundle protein